MVTLTSVEFGYGTIGFRNEVEAIPTTSETTGNVTVNNMGSPGVLAHYDASFMLSCDFEKEGIRLSNIFHWHAIVVGKPKNSPYSEIEAEAARQIAPMLRDVATAIEQQVADYDKSPKKVN